MNRLTRLRPLLVLAGFLAVAPAWLCPAQSEAPSDPVVAFFYQEGCPDCVKIGEVLDLLAGDLPEGAVVRYEIGDPTSKRLFQRLKKAYGVEASGVPLVFVGDRFIAGAGLAQELTLTDAISRCARSPCPSPLDRLPPDVFPWIDVAQLALLGLVVVLLFLLQRP